MSIHSLPLLTDGDLGAIEPSATSATKPWGAVTWPAQRDDARRELVVWLEADFGPGASSRLLDRWAPDKAFKSTGGSMVDITSELSNRNEEDVDLAAVLTTPGTDALYIGLASEFDGLAIRLLDSLNAAASTLAMAYWGPTGWTALAAADGTAVSGATLARTGRVTWPIPGDWEKRQLGGSATEYFFVRLMVSAALTAGTAATQILPTRSSSGLRRVAAYLALAGITNGMALSSVDPDHWRDAAKDYRQAALGLYTRLKESGSLLLDENNDQVIDAPERNVARPVRLQRG